MPHTAAPLGPLRILLIEDSPEDAELLSEQLLDAGLDAEFLRVDDAEGLYQALSGFHPDVVLSDLAMPGFSGYQALEMLRQQAPATPFIFVSGTIGEDAAVQALQQGASDYILKHSPARLPPAVARAVRLARSEAERERAEKELLRSQRLDCLAMLAAGLSHDLRNVLQPLLIVPDLLNAHSDDPKIRRLGEIISECGRRGHEMAESMLSFVRGSRATREHVSVPVLFRAVQMLLQGTLPDSVRLVVEPPSEALSIDVNYTELQQSLLNLGLNAIQAMPHGGTVTLAAATVQEEGGEMVCLRVSDTGVGMDADIVSKLFTPFFTTKGNGTGLGLMSSKRIVESYGGHIRVSTEPGKGSTFELRLPMAQVDAPDEQAETPAEGHDRRVLVVDSDATRLSLLVNALTSQGYDPVQAPDVAYALRTLEAGARLPELVMLDTDMALLPVVQLLRAMVDRGYAGPVVALENPQRPFDRSGIPEGLVLHVLPKPLQMRTLLLTVGRALEPAAP